MMCLHGNPQWLNFTQDGLNDVVKHPLFIATFWTAAGSSASLRLHRTWTVQTTVSVDYDISVMLYITQLSLTTKMDITGDRSECELWYSSRHGLHFREVADYGDAVGPASSLLHFCIVKKFRLVPNVNQNGELVCSCCRIRCPGRVLLVWGEMHVFSWSTWRASKKVLTAFRYRDYYPKLDCSRCFFKAYGRGFQNSLVLHLHLIVKYLKFHLHPQKPGW